MNGTPVGGSQPGAAAPLRARLATNLLFLLNGLAFATWGVHVPTFKQQHGLNEGEVALAMLAAGVGALVAVLYAGAWVGRWGARAVCGAAGVLTGASIGAVLWMPSLGAGIATLFVFGLCNSLFDVAMNAHAAEVETAYGRPIMSSCHGFFSLGGLAGAALGSAMALWQVAPTRHTTGAAIAVGLLALAALPAMLPDRDASQDAPAHGFVRPRGVIALLGAMAAFGLVAEGAMYDWSVLYLRESLGSPQALAALAYASFSLAMAAGRFAGDRVRARVGASRLLRGSGVLAAVALLLVLLVGRAELALPGFALVGLGIANVVPVLFASAAAVPGVTPAHAIAGVASLGYLGFLGGPPLIGAVAQATRLPPALGLVALFALALAVLARPGLPSPWAAPTQADNASNARALPASRPSST